MAARTATGNATRRRRREATSDVRMREQRRVSEVRSERARTPGALTGGPEDGAPSAAAHPSSSTRTRTRLWAGERAVEPLRSCPRAPPSLTSVPTSYLSSLPIDIAHLLPQYWLREVAAYRFNTAAKVTDAVDWMLREKVIEDRGDSLVTFMLDCRALLDPTRAGEFLCKRETRELARKYVHGLGMAGLTLDEAFR